MTSSRERDIKVYLDTATFALNRAIGLLMMENDMKDVRRLQGARDVTVALHKEFSE